MTMTLHRESRGARLRKSKGFTLVEIMIVIAIMAILLMIAIPNMLHCRTANLHYRREAFLPVERGTEFRPSP